MADADKHTMYSLADIQRYLAGSMSAREMHELERAALEDPFLADALEGYSEADMQQAQTHFAQIETAILQQKKKHKVVALPPSPKYRNWQVAASIAVLIGIAGLSYFIYNKKGNQEPLTRAESSSIAPAPDSAQIRMQTVIPPGSDTITLAQKKPVPNEKNKTSLLADNKKIKSHIERKRHFDEKQVKSDTEKTAPSANDALVAQTLSGKAAGIITDSQSLLSRNAEPSATSQIKITADSIGKDSNKAIINAKAKQADNLITGIVVDQHQQPVPNAMVALKGRTAATVTDSNGNFRLPATDSTAEVDISAIGYASATKQLKNGTNRITLNEENSSLAEVVVTALGARRSKTADTTIAMPEGGWQSFREYIYNKLHIDYDNSDLYDNSSGDLQLEFFVDKSGEPFNFKILNTPDTLLASEAIKAIREGPKWTSGSKNRKKKVTVRF